MEPQTPDKPKVYTTPKPLLALFKFNNKVNIVLGIVVILVIAAVIAFRLVQLSKKSLQPTLQTTSSQKTRPTFPPPTAYQKGPFKCPSIPQFCQTGQDVLVRGSYTGFGVKLPPNSPLYAAFDGELTFKRMNLVLNPYVKQQTQQINVVFLTDKAHSLRAAYYFPGRLSGKQLSGIIKEGGTIATASGEPMNLYGQTSLVFALTRNDPLMDTLVLGGEKVKLGKTDFKQ